MTGTYITVYCGSRDLATFRCTVTGAPTADTHQNSNINTSLVSTKHVYSTATDPLGFLSHSGFISNLDLQTQKKQNITSGTQDISNFQPWGFSNTLEKRLAFTKRNLYVRQLPFRKETVVPNVLLVPQSFSQSLTD